MSTKEDLLALAVRVKTIAAAVDKANEKLDKLAELRPLLEHVNETVLVIAEGQTAMRKEILRSMTEMEERLEQRIATLEGAVRTLAADVTALKADFTGLRSEVADLRRSFERRDDLEALEKRVTLLEKELAGRST